MAKVRGIVDAFRSYGATLANAQWAVSAEIPGAIVMSLWESEFQKPGMLYVDNLARWRGPGNNLFRRHLQMAFNDKLPVCLVIAKACDPDAIRRGVDASTIPKTFSVRPELVVNVERLDGENFAIRFIKR